MMNGKYWYEFYGFIPPLGDEEFKLILNIIITLAFLGWLIFIYLIIPRKIEVISSKIDERKIVCLLYGFIGFLLIIPVAILLIISIVGIILIPIEIILVAVIFLIGSLSAGLWLGRRVIKGLNWDIQSPILEILLGITIIRFVGLIPGWGGLIKFLICLTGIGAVIMTKFGSDSKWLERRLEKGQADVTSEETKNY